MSDDRQERRSPENVVPGEEQLSRLYEQTKEELPPPSLDAAVVAEAQRAVARPSPTAHVYFFPSRKWAIPLALAAALLVSIGVVREFHKDIIVPTSSSISPMFSRGMLQDEEARKEFNDSLLLEKKKSESGMAKEPVAPANEFVAPKLAAPAPETQSREGGLHIGTPTESGRHDAQSAPAIPRALSEKDERAETTTTQALPRSKERQLLSAPSRPQNAPETKEQTSVDALKEQELSPEAWIRKINELRRAGKTTEAEENVKKFKKRYPDYPLEKFLEQTTTSSPR